MADLANVPLPTSRSSTEAYLRDADDELAKVVATQSPMVDHGMAELVTVATCNLNQWAMDFDGNMKNVIASIEAAKELGATFRTGPELELSGYGCEDHFLEQDTFFHCWESIGALIEKGLTNGILCDIGMPVMHRNTRYNCRVFLLNGRIVLIRPKMHMADDGNYREGRWFTAWDDQYRMEEHVLPPNIQRVTRQRNVPFGVAIIRCNDGTLASETCEELFTPQSPHILLGLGGAEIIANGSGSHHNLRKLNQRMDLIRSATSKGGGCYLYANQQGCDGGRLYYDGCCLVSVNGDVVAQGLQFSIRDVEVVTAVVNLTDIRSYRASIASRGAQSRSVRPIATVDVNFNLTMTNAAIIDHEAVPNVPMPPRYHTVEEEIAYGPACWLWDYVRRSGAGGFFLPLSGGADSSATAAIVSVMCQLVFDGIMASASSSSSSPVDGSGAMGRASVDTEVLDELRRVVGDDDFMPKDAQEIAYRIMHTCYMGTVNSSNETRSRAKQLANEVGAYHLDTNIDTVVASIVALFQMVTGKRPQFRANGGSLAENLALQNIQARIRMVFSYMLAQLLPWTRGQSGFLLVLGSANVDEALRGYMTKYDCSSADINPIGGISKEDLRRFLLWAAQHAHLPSLQHVVAAPPTAELEPITADYTQSDEVDMGMTYAELGVFGRLRKIYRCGPVSMYEKLRHVWSHLEPSVVAQKVKSFFYYYSVNRHKLTTLTPSYHAENYSPDDNRYDLRQFLYNRKWPRQFNNIDQLSRRDTEQSNTMLPRL